MLFLARQTFYGKIYWLYRQLNELEDSRKKTQDSMALLVYMSLLDLVLKKGKALIEDCYIYMIHFDSIFPQIRVLANVDD